MTDPAWGTSWMFVETRDGRRGSLRMIEYADPPVAFVNCPNHCYRVSMPDPDDRDEPMWAEGDLIECPACGAPDVPVIAAFWHESYAFIEWYRQAGAADWVAVECEDCSANIRPVNWRPVLDSERA